LPAVTADGRPCWYRISRELLATIATIAAVALFLASDGSSFVAGAELSVEGGMAQV